ncbi:MAG TPA: ATP-binding protein [Blastocatellia bacterium]|nr:ATP-binding protein [Blastocatellia bacterium]
MMLNEAALRWMNDLSAQGIFMTDEDLTIREWNHWLEVRSGRSASEMIGQSLLDQYPDLTERGLDKCYRDALAGQVVVLSYRLHRYLIPMTSQSEDMALVKMQQSARIAPLIENDRVVGTITIIDDVTERVAHEQQLVRLLAREQAARIEAEAANRSKDEFLATVSHELRTPLNAISGWVQILRKNPFDQDCYTQGIERIERNVKVQTKLIEDILDVSRIITGKLYLDVSPVNLAPVIEAALESIRLAADAKGIRLLVSLDYPDGLVAGDPNRLQQVVWNLVSNAIKFTPEGGVVSVRLERVGSHAEITVGDSGKGISPEFLPFVFDRFRQADSTSTRRHSGLGLGLAIVRHLVEMHGGTVQAASQGEGQGATFTVRLPIISSRSAEIPVTQNTGDFQSHQPARYPASVKGPSFDDVSNLNGLRVLVVDDEPEAREMLRIMLIQFGAEVRVSASAQEVLETLERWIPEVLVSDVGMPDEDGYFLIRKLRSLGREAGGRIPAVALTGYARPEDRQRLLSAGYQAHLTKPVELAELVNTIASLARREGKGHYTSVE